MVIKLFKGQVKIADVKDAFDEIIEKVNGMIDGYNHSSYINDIDYSIGGPELAPSGYTLTVGGMKQLMNSCDGTVIGAKPFRVSSSKLKMTTGLLITKHGIYRLPDSVLAIPTDKQYRTLYYNTTTGEYQLTGQGTISTVVTEDKLVGSRLYYGLSNNPKAMILRKEVYDHNEEGGFTLFANSPQLIDGQDIEHVDFCKYNAGENTTESVKSGKFKLPIEMYAHVSGNLTGNDTLILKLKDSGAAYRNGVSLGTYNPDLGIFEPKLDIAFSIRDWYYWSVNIQGCQKFGIHENGSPYYLFSPIGSCIGGKEENPKFVHIKFKRNELGLRVAEVSFVDSEGAILSTRDIQMPLDIDSYNINTLIPRTWYMSDAINTVDGDPVEDRNPRAVWYKDDCMIRRNDGTEIGLSTESQTISINKVEVIESDTAAYKICDINPNAETKLISNIKGVQNEEVNGTFKITSQSRWVKPVCTSDNGTFRGETPDTSSQPLFIWGQEAVGHKGGKRLTCNLFLFGKKVQWNTYAGHRKLDWWSPLNMLFVPRGVANPYTYDSPSSDFTHWFKVNISKNIKDT